MTRSTEPPVNGEGTEAKELPNHAPQLATTAEAQTDDQRIAWLRAGPEVFHAPVAQSRSRQIIGLPALAVVVTGLAVAALVYFQAQDSPDRADSEQITAPLATEPPPERPTTPVVAADAAPVIPPAPMAAPVAPATSPEAPVSSEAPAPTAAPKRAEQVPAAGNAESRSTRRREPSASTRPPAPAPPTMTPARRPSGADEDQISFTRPTPTPRPCETDCTEPTLTRTPTTWTPERP